MADRIRNPQTRGGGSDNPVDAGRAGLPHRNIGPPATAPLDARNDLADFSPRFREGFDAGEGKATVSSSTNENWLGSAGTFESADSVASIWSATGCVLTQSSTQAHNSTYSMKVEKTGSFGTAVAAADFGEPSGRLSVSPGQSVDFEAWVYAPSLLRTVQLRFTFFDADDNEIGFNFSTHRCAADTWTRTQINIVAIQGTVKIVPSVQILFMSAADVVYVDDVKVMDGNVFAGNVVTRRDGPKVQLWNNVVSIDSQLAGSKSGGVVGHVIANATPYANPIIRMQSPIALPTTGRALIDVVGENEDASVGSSISLSAKTVSIDGGGFNPNTVWLHSTNLTDRVIQVGSGYFDWGSGEYVEASQFAGRTVTVMAWLQGELAPESGQIGRQVGYARLAISLDNGSSYTAGPEVSRDISPNSIIVNDVHAMQHIHGAVTGAVRVKAQADARFGTAAAFCRFRAGHLIVQIFVGAH